MLNENIKRIREERGMTQKQLADKVGISGAFMSLIEKGTNKPSDENLKKIANALDVPVEILKKPKQIKPSTQLINLLIELTRQGKIKWKSETKDLYDEILSYEDEAYSTIVNGNKYFIVIHNVDLNIKDPEYLEEDYEQLFDNALYSINLSNGDEQLIASFIDDAIELTKLFVTIEYTAEKNNLIFNQIDELKKLLDEDKKE